MSQAVETQRLRIDDNTWEVECAFCGRSFTAARSDASFCCAKHRVAYSREPQKRANALEFIRSMGIQLEQMGTKYNTDDEVFKAMDNLRNKLTVILGEFEGITQE